MGGSAGDPQWCPTLRPTRADFSKPFMAYVEEAFKANPGAAMLKIVPPKGWTPRTAAFPPLDELRISTPIKQHVSRCMRCSWADTVFFKLQHAAACCLRHASALRDALPWRSCLPAASGRETRISSCRRHGCQ